VIRFILTLIIASGIMRGVVVIIRKIFNNFNVNIPKKGAGRKLADRLKKLGKQRPPTDIVNKINKDE
jgi:hypothetical protein